jgi:hypothetical protein
MTLVWLVNVAVLLTGFNNNNSSARFEHRYINITFYRLNS